MVRLDLDRLRTLAKQRKRTTGGTLAAAQLAIAREHGQQSWRALVDHVRTARTAPRAEISEERVAAFLRDVGGGNLDAVRAALAQTPALVNAVGPHPFWGGRLQSLHVAIETNRQPMIQLLLRAGANVDGDNADYEHWSPLLIALNDPKRAASRRALVRRGVTIGLVEALAMGDDVRVARLLRRGRAALPAIVPSGGSVMAFARTRFAIDRLLALGVSADAKDRWNTSPIEAIAKRGPRAAPLVRYLVTKGVAVAPETLAQIGDRTSLAKLPPETLASASVIEAAVRARHVQLASWLLDRGASPQARANWGSKGTLLHAAAWNGDTAMVDLLLERGADPTALDEEHRTTPAEWADVSLGVTNNPECAAIAQRLRRDLEIRTRR